MPPGAAQEAGAKADAAKEKNLALADPFAPRDPNVVWMSHSRDYHVRTEVFALPLTAARQAMRQFPKQADLYNWLVLEMEKPAATVQLERMDLLRIRGGHRAKVEGINEYPSPTAYDPAEVSASVVIGEQSAAPAKGTENGAAAAVPNKGETVHAAAAGFPAEFPAAGPAGSVPASRVVPPWPYKPPTPTGISTINMGWVQEMGITGNDEGTGADLNLFQEFVRPAGFGMSSGEVEGPVAAERRRISQSMRTPFGTPVFGGTFNRAANTGAAGKDTDREDAGRLIFFMVHPTREPIKITPPPDGDDAAAPADPFAVPPPKPAAGAAQRVSRDSMVRFDAISLPPAAARKALITHAKKETELYQWLETELNRKDSGVTLENSSTLRVRGGQRAKSEPIIEFPHVGEITVGQTPQSVSLPGPATGGSTAIPGTASAFTPWPQTSTTPSATATKHLGWTIEVEITGEDGIIDINLVAEKIRLAGRALFGVNKEVMYPVFETQKLSCQAECSNGKAALLSTFTPPTGTGIPGANTSDRVWFLFATVARAE